VQLLLHDGTQGRTAGELAPLRSRRTRPRISVRSGRAITPGSAVGIDLAADRRRCPAQIGGDPADRVTRRQTAGDLLPLGHAQPTSRPVPRVGPDAPTAHQIRPHRAGGQAQLARCRFGGLARPKPKPNLINRLRRQPLITPTTHRNLLDHQPEKCCVDPLRPPACPRVVLRVK
jgi:hypothetical protein